ncbi:cytochrome P450 [Ramicandelaber brevisporus]|nr:cytochrome P450 [Ramicandelaber brevisporus]
MTFTTIVLYTVGALLTVVAYLVIKVWLAIRVPRQLTHLPILPFFDQLRILSNEPTVKRVNESTEAIVNNPDCHLMFAFGEYILVLKNPTLFKESFEKSAIFDKYDMAETEPDGLTAKFVGNNVVFARTTGTWKMHRRILNPAFNRGFDPNIFGDGAKIAIKKILDAPQNTLEAWPLMTEVGLNGLTRFAFGFQPGDVGQRLLELFMQVTEAILNPLYIMLAGIDRSWNPMRRADFKRVDEMEMLLYQMVEQKRKEASSVGGFDKVPNPDVLTYLVEAYTNSDSSDIQGGQQFDAAMLRGDLAAIMIAGSDTSSNALNSAIFLLATHPEIQDKARKHVFEVLGKTSEDIVPTSEEQKQLTYLTQIIKESMRLYPPTLQASWRRLTEDYKLGDYFIPKGTLLLHNFWLAHRNPQFWGDDAAEFRPDRFEDDTKDSFSSTKNPYWTPFGYGLRVCLGMQFAYMEIRVVLAMLLRRFEWKLADSHPGTLEHTSSALPRVVTNQITFTPRY